MTILNLYQMVFLLAIAGVFAAGYWAKRHMKRNRCGMRGAANAMRKTYASPF